MIEWVIRALRETGIERIVVVIGHGAETVRQILGDRVEYAVQHEQLGTAHAVSTAQPLLKGHSGPVFVLSGDVPLISVYTLSMMLGQHGQSQADLTLATFRLPDPDGYGRVVRDGDGHVAQIIEHKDANREVLAIDEVNAGVYCFDSARLFELLPKVKNDNMQGEYYLPDVIRMISESRGKIEVFESEDPDEFRGINDRWQLAEASAIVKERILRRHSRTGVTFIDPASTTVGPDVKIGADTVIHANTILEGDTVVGEECEIGPNTWVKSSRIGSRCRVFMSHLDQASMGDGSRCGPFSNLRPGANLEASAKIGNFVEIKNSTIGSETSISHLTYIGDARIGQRSNIGAGTITCNYDGFSKHLSEVGNDCFIGSNSTLVAPIKVGDGSMVAAGSVVTHEVPAGSMAIGRGRQENKEGWYINWRAKKTQEQK